MNKWPKKFGKTGKISSRFIFAASLVSCLLLLVSVPSALGQNPHTKWTVEMFCMYILKSSMDGKLYVGSTSNLAKRVKEHNAGLVQSTKPRRPFRVAYVEAYTDESEARHREHNLKLNARAWQQLKKRISKSLAIWKSWHYYQSWHWGLPCYSRFIVYLGGRPPHQMGNK